MLAGSGSAVVVLREQRGQSTDIALGPRFQSLTQLPAAQGLDIGDATAPLSGDRQQIRTPVIGRRKPFHEAELLQRLELVEDGGRDDAETNSRPRFAISSSSREQVPAEVAHARGSRPRAVQPDGRSALADLGVSQLPASDVHRAHRRDTPICICNVHYTAVH